MSVTINLYGVKLRADGRYIAPVADTWDEPGEDEGFELEALYTEHGDDILDLVFFLGKEAQISHEALLAYKDNYAAELAEHLDNERKERLAG